jgi:ABC-type lipoprotein release transport system permease subunit
MNATGRRQPASELFRLAFRNLGRHRVKTVLTVTAAALGILAYLYMDAFLLGTNTESRRNLVNFEMGAAKIYSKAYWEKKDEFPLYEGFSNYRGLTDALRGAGYDAAPRATFVGTLLSRNEELPFVFIGMDPAAEKKTLRYYRYVETADGGHFPRDGVFEILLGVKGATDLKVKTGDTVRLITVVDKRDDKGVLRHINQVIDLVVAGTLNSPDPMVNGYFGYIPLSVLQDELGILLEGSVTELLVRKTGAREDELPGRFESPAAITAALGSALPRSLLVTSWEENAKDYLAASTGDIVQSIVFLGFFFVIVLMVISNTILMSILERTREIGMLRALGMTDGAIVELLCIETGLIGLFGALIGLVLFIPINYLMVNYGIDYSSMIEESGMSNFGYRIVGIFKSAWNYPTMVLSIFASVILSSVTALIPSRRAVRMTVTDALRTE